MSLRLFDRIAALVRADAHGVVDALEERSLLLKQSLRDAELELLQKRARVEALAQEEERVRERAARCGAALAALDEDVELALAGGREELARFAIRRLLPLRSERTALEREAASLAASRSALAERLAAQEAELEELRARVRARLAQGPRPGGGADELGPPPVDDAEVELELLRRRGPAHGAEGTAHGTVGRAHGAESTAPAGEEATR
jgi:phage shock protein A